MSSKCFYSYYAGIINCELLLRAVFLFSTSRPTSSPHAKSIQLGDAQPTVPICLGKSKRAKSCPKDWISNYFVPPESNSPTTVDIQKQDCVRLGSASTQRPESSKTGDTRDTKCRKRSAGKAKVMPTIFSQEMSSVLFFFFIFIHFNEI